MARKQTFEAGMGELETLTGRLAQGDMTLDETMKTYEKGMALAAQLRQQLADCRKRVEQIDLDTAEITPFEEKNHLVYVSRGTTVITMEYPYLKEGALISAVAAVLTAALWSITGKRAKKEKLQQEGQTKQ